MSESSCPACSLSTVSTAAQATATAPAHSPDCPRGPSAGLFSLGSAPTITRVSGPRAVPRGTTLGRYIVLEELGAGGMGVVYAAYDPELDRRVALKLLATRSGADASARLLREAQAMARLSHPNVVAVFDVGTLGDEVFVAMELVRGQSLRAWSRQTPRPWREVLRVFVEAGTGLAAAHRSGLIHRDFKPDNVLIDEEGRARVTDFGLALAMEARPQEEGLSASGSGEPQEVTLGAVVGTPAYMPPEQMLGQPVDARTDVFSFCVAFHECLYGARPFSGRSLAELREQVLLGKVAGTTQRSRVPAWLRRIVSRGLSPAPEQRWADLDALLGAIEAATRRRKRAVLAGVVALIASVGAVFGLTSRGEAPCSGAEERLAGLWDPGRRAGVATAFLGTAAPFAAASWGVIEPVLDDYATGWRTMHRQACLATHRGEQSAAVLDRRMDCLDSRLQELGALVGVLERPSAAVQENAVQAAQRLTPLARCEATTLLRSGDEQPLGPAQRARADAIRLELARAKALADAAQFQEARRAATRAEEAARAADLTSLHAEALLSLAQLDEAAGEPQRARASAEQAYWLGLRFGMDFLAARALLALARCEGVGLVRTQAGLRHLHLAEALVARVGEPPELRLELVHLAGQVRLSAEHFAEAVPLLERAVLQVIALRGENHLETASVRSSLGTALTVLRRWGPAVEQLRAAHRIRERLLGPAHPWVAVSLNNLGVLLLYDDQLAEAEKYFRRAMVTSAAELAEHPAVSNTHLNLGIVALYSGRLPQAQTHFERAVAIRLSRFGEGSLRYAFALQYLAQAAELQGRLAEAEALTRRSLAIREKAAGDDRAALPRALNELGRLLLLSHRTDEALPLFERALQLAESLRERGQPSLAGALLGVGCVRLERGDAAGAVQALERALPLAQADRRPSVLAARVGFALARALHASGGPAPGGAAPRARELAATSLARLRGYRFPEADTVAAWLKNSAAR